MNQLLNAIQPSNHTQRVLLFVAIIFSMAVLIIHNPTDGYDIENIYSYNLVPCRADLHEDALAGKLSWDEYMTELNSCGNQTKSEDRSFLQWSSKAPVILWFGSILHALISLLAVWTIYIVGTRIFTDSESQKNDKKPK